MKVEWHRKDAILDLVEDHMHPLLKFGGVEGAIGHLVSLPVSEIGQLSKAIQKGRGYPRRSGELACDSRKILSLGGVDGSGIEIEVGERNGDKDIGRGTERWIRGYLDVSIVSSNGDWRADNGRRRLLSSGNQLETFKDKCNYTHCRYCH